MKTLCALLVTTLFATPALALDLSSKEVAEGKTMGDAQVYKGFGCEGGNLSPSLQWQHAPAGTRSFAVTVYDPDAPTGSGWWHWQVYDIPADVHELPAGAVVQNALPDGAKQGRNDFGERNFGGACPPPGDKPHHYLFTVYALKVDKLGVPDDASAALVGYMLHANSLESATLTALYGR
jgi:Raf kinase inhibitor-like YbhB/YbcL family protein